MKKYKVRIEMTWEDYIVRANSEDEAIAAARRRILNGGVYPDWEIKDAVEVED